MLDFDEEDGPRIFLVGSDFSPSFEAILNWPFKFTNTQSVREILLNIENGKDNKRTNKSLQIFDPYPSNLFRSQYRLYSGFKVPFTLLIKNIEWYSFTEKIDTDYVTELVVSIWLCVRFLA